MGVEQRIIGRSGDQLEITGHGLASNAAVRVFASPAASLPTPLVANTVYYVRSIDADHIELSATSGPGAAITLTSGLSGDVWVQTVPSWINTILVADATYGAGTLKDFGGVEGRRAERLRGQDIHDLNISGTARAKYASRTLARVVRQPMIKDDDALSLNLGSFDAVVDDVWYAMLGMFHMEPLWCPLRSTDDPAAHASFPASLPKVSVFRRRLSTNADSIVDGPDPDTSADPTAYSAIHAITCTVDPVEVIDNTDYIYLVKLTWEGGANSADGDVMGATYSFTSSSYDDGAA